VLLPVEVKSGATGTLKSLGVFMGKASHTLAIRIYGGAYCVNTQVQTGFGPPFTLVNIPLYLTCRWQDIIREFV
jgi:hypothetical protein